MTLEQFAARFKALLEEAVRANLDTDDIGQLAESILEGDWSTEYAE